MTSRSDLVVLAADKDVEHAIRGLLSRSSSLRIQEINSRIIVHPGRDPGCFMGAPDILRGFVRTHGNALVIFDREGCGRDAMSRQEIETDLERRLQANGWGERCAAVVIDPELEAWIWSDSVEVDAVLGWQGRDPSLREWLRGQRLLAEGEHKPDRPKEAHERALRHVSRPRSAALIEELARRVSTRRCTDAAFAKLISTLQAWFPIQSEPQP